MISSLYEVPVRFVRWWSRADCAAAYVPPREVSLQPRRACHPDKGTARAGLAARHWLRLQALLLCLFAALPAFSQAPTAIVNVTLVHPERSAAEVREPDSTVLVQGDRIVAAGRADAIQVPADAEVIEARGKWLIPGLVDAHVHFDQSGNLYARPDIADLTRWMPYAQEQARNHARLRETFAAWLRSGVTSVVDIGGPLWSFQVRAAARRSPDAPRVLAAGPLVSMVARTQLDLGDPPIVKVSTPQEARAVVRRTLEHKPDFIKVWFIHQAGDDLAQQAAIVSAAGEEAHAAGVRLAVHATELDVAKAALRAGADYLVHSVEDAPVDAEFLALAKQRQVLYCPTLFVYEGYGLALSNRWRPTAAEQRFADPQVLAMMDDLDEIPRELLPGWMRRAIEQGWSGRLPPHAAANLRRVWDAGITVVVGSDAGNIGTLHGPAIFREMQRMAQADLTPLEVLRAATVNGAEVMGMAGQIGRIAPGFLADMVILDADPLADVTNLSRVHAVVRAGRVHGVR
jgi:imidazolonepropionase-like amidohydrolase